MRLREVEDIVLYTVSGLRISWEEESETTGTGTRRLSTTSFTEWWNENDRHK